MFDLEKWRLELAEVVGSYNAFQDLVTNKDTLNFYASSLKIMSFSNDDFYGELKPDVTDPETQILTRYVPTNEDTLEKLRLMHIDDIKNANRVYRRQMIVLATTYIDGIIFEFLQNLFVAHPTRMYEYLNDNADKTLKGKVDLREILESDTKEFLISKLASRAASIVTSGKFEATLNNLSRVTKVKLDITLVEKLKKIVEQRNRIVHEASKEVVTRQHVLDNFDYITDFLEVLRKIAKDNHIPYFDPIE